MENFLSYESKVMQILLTLADMILLNLLFIICCIPIFTIGAAQAGLYNGIRQLMNKEDDTSCFKAYFRGFFSGFRKITLAHSIFSLLIAGFAYMLYILFVLKTGGFQSAPTWITIIALAITVLFSSMLSPFHASFDCTVWQLIRNMYFVVMAYFVRSVSVAVLIWLPVGVAMLDLYIFMRALPIWTLIYYSLAFLFIFTLTKKPFEDLKQDFLNKQAPESP